MAMKRVNTQAYLDSMLEILQMGKTIVIPVKGMSMKPFLQEDRDRVELKSADDCDLQPGDIVLFSRRSGGYVLHRLVRQENGLWIIQGDNCNYVEHVHPTQIQALALRAERNGKWIGPESAVWQFYASMWNRFMFLRKASGLASRMKKTLTGKKQEQQTIK